MTHMTSTKYITLFFILTFFLCIPAQSMAATIRASSSTALSAGDTAIISVFLDTEGETINSIDGAVLLTDTHGGNFTIKDISVSNSVFTLWPRKPSLGEGHRISLIGGIPGGITGDSLLLFKAIVTINEAGTFSIRPDTLVAYLNDGLGTTRTITKDTSTITVGQRRAATKDNWQEIISNDNVAPETFGITLVQDTNLYEGKKFLSFETTDTASGISYYTVKEGAYPSVRTGNSYILIDQNIPEDVVVTAYDKAGNFQVSVFKNKTPIQWGTVGVALLGISGIYIIYKRSCKKTNA